VPDQAQPSGVPGAQGDITSLLRQVRDGKPDDAEALYRLVYDRLKQLARQRLRGVATPTLDVTALVHEVYLRLADASRLEWQDRQHFFATAARAMRQIIVDHARRHQAAKRGGRWVATTLGDEHGASTAVPIEHVLAIDQALERLNGISPRLVHVVELCFFAGLTTEEAADALGVTARTVKRDWQKARLLLGAWLRETQAGTAPGSDPA
jgi:RNA polymerase sigma factor (TIGR02999 family)